jgi:nitrate/nitrite transporter NarK
LEFYLLGILSGIGKALYFGIFIYIIINNWFISRHGFVTGFVSAFTGVSGAACSPLFSAIISNISWRAGYIFMGILVILLNLPIILLNFSLNPADEGASPYLENGDSAKKRHPLTSAKNTSDHICDITLLACFMIYNFLALGITTFPQHFPSYLNSLGYPASVGAWTVSLCLMGNILAKVSFGTLSDHFGPAKVTLFMLAVNLLSIVMLYQENNVVLLMTGAFLFGSIYSISAVSVSLTLQERCGLREYQRVFPYVNLFGNVGLALFVSIFGYIYDLAGSYIPAFAMIVLFEAAIVAILAVIYIRTRIATR